MYLHRVVVPAVALAALACGSALPSEDAEDQGSASLTAPSLSLTATPSTIARGGTARLMPSFTAGTGTLSPGMGKVKSGVPLFVRPAVTTTYTLRVEFRDRVTSQSVTVTVASTVPAPAGPILVYDDALAPGWQDWSWVQHDLANPSPVSGGTRSIAVNFTPWSGLSFFVPGGVAAASDGTLEFDVNGGSRSNPAINAMAQIGGAWGPEVRIAPYCQGAAIPTGSFTHCAVPLAALQAANVTFERFALKEASGLTLPTVYVDRISIVPTAAPQPQIQSFTATPPAIDSGGSAVLSAQYGGGAGTIDLGVGPIASGGTVTVSPITTTTYTLTVAGAAGAPATSSVTVIVNPPPAGRAILVYDDALAAGWQDWSWVDHDLANVAPVSSGTRSISVNFSPWSGLSFFLPGGVSGAGAGTLEFDVNGGATSNPAINAMAQVGGTWGPEIRINGYCQGGAIPAASFTHCKVPLSALQAGNATFERFALKEASGLTLPAMYVDQISIVPAGVVPPPPQIQSFTATPVVLSAGGSAVLSAVYSGGNGSIDQGVGAIASGATVTVSPAASTTYTLTVSDAGGHVVTASVTVTVNPLPAVASFTVSPATIAVGGTAALSATYSGGTGSIDQGVGPIASGATVTVSPAATTTYTLTVRDAGGHVATASVTVTVNPLPAVESFTVSPATIAVGGTAALSATYSGGTGSIDQGVGPIASGATVTVSPIASTTYTLSVSDGAGNVAKAMVTLTVVPPPSIQTFTASPSTISAGDRATLSAAYTGGIGIVDQGVGPLASGATVAVSPSATTTYTLTVSDGAGNLARATATITVNPLPAIQSFSASPATISAGGSATLSATYSGGTGSIDQGVGAIASGASVTVSPAATATYTLTVSDGAGHTATRTATVTVNPLPAIQSFSASPAAISAGGSATLSATYSGGTGSIDQGVGAIASGGSVTVSPAATTTYTLTVSDGAGHTATRSATVTVNPLPAIQSFSASPAAISAGGSATLSATYSGGTGSIDQGVGAIASGGSVTVSPAVTTTYTLTVSDGAGHSATATTAVMVAGSTPPDISDIIPPDRLTVWEPGLMAVGGIPARTTVCATVDASTFGNGAQEASAGIQAAIDRCPAGQVVQLSAGTFLTNHYVLVNKSITLRGAGPAATTLQKTNGAKLDLEVPPDAQPIVIIGPNRFPKPDESTSQDLTADGAKGSHTVTVANSGGFAPGQIVWLDELSGASWQVDRLGRGQIWASPDWRVVWQFHNPSYGGDDPLTATTPTGGDAATWFSRRDRVTAEMKEIIGVSGNVVTFSTPLHISYRTSHKAQLTRSTGGDVHVKMAGVESLKAVGGSDGAIRFENAAYSWMKAVEITIWHGEGVAVDKSFRIEVRDSYIHDAAWAQPGGAGYAISLAQATAEALFENNISVMANKVMVARCAGAGSVFGYNYVDDGYINTIEGWIEIGLNASHMVGPHHVLFEGNYGFNWDSDHTHGNSIYHTVFRNHLRGIRKPFNNPHTGDAVDDNARAANGPRRCVGATAYSYWMSFVGNVLGAEGQMGGFVYDGVGIGAMETPAIWLLGWDDASPQPYDPATALSTLRHGNFDYLTGQVAWDPLIADHVLPDSLYLPQKPAFFNAGSGYTWPWVEPDAATKLYKLPAKARYDAGTPFVQP